MVVAVVKSPIVFLLDSHFEASSLHFGRRHLGFLEPEVTIFGKDGDTVLTRQKMYSLIYHDTLFPIT